MRKQYFKIFSFSLLLSVWLPLAAVAGEPTDSIKACTDKLLTIVSDANLQSPEMKAKREQMIMETVDKVFSWEEFAKRSLARNWNKRTIKERKEFVALFRQLIADTYIGKTYQYSGESITYLDEEIDGDHGNVTSVFNTSDGKKIPVEYCIIQKGDSWRVYDLKIKGSSLVANYRRQFKEIISRSSYEDLVVQLKKKLEKIN